MYQCQKLYKKDGINHDYNKRHEKKMEDTGIWDIDIHFTDSEDSSIKKCYHWFQVRPSTIEGAGLGLFAARKFSDGEVIGLYMGRTEANKKKGSDYSLRSETVGLVDAKRGFRPTTASMPQYEMGIHMINDPTMHDKNG